MTDNTIPADNLARNIRTVVDLATAPGNHYTKADVIEHLEALLPKPRTLADELSEFVESLLAGASVSDVELQLIRFADRVETLEQVHDAHLAEIARLRAREIPNGWRVADHPAYGPVLAAECQDKDGDVHYVRLGTSLHDLIYRGLAYPSTLSFRDEAPAPERVHIDPTTCGPFRPYLVEQHGLSRQAIRAGREVPNDENHCGPWMVFVEAHNWKWFHDDELTVIRPLTYEEMDAR